MAKDTIRIFRPYWMTAGDGGNSKYSWYFLDSRKRRMPCRSGYEALFATYLVSRSIHFEYEALVLVVTGKALYIPDFFLTHKGEFVELKGWTGSSAEKQAKKISLLRSKGFVIHVLDWTSLCKAIHSPYLHYKSFFDVAVRNKKSVEDFIAQGAWLPPVPPRPSAGVRKRRKR